MTAAFRPTDLSRLAAGALLRPDRVGGGHVLVYPEGVLVLNPTAAAALALVDGRRTIAAVAAILSARYAGALTVETDVVTLITRLRDRGLVHVNPGDAGDAP